MIEKPPNPLPDSVPRTSAKPGLENLQKRASLATLRYSKTSHYSFKPKAIKKYTPRNNSKRSFRVSFNALDKHPSDQSETSRRTLFGLCPSCRTTTSCYHLCRTVTPKPAAVAANGRKQKKKSPKDASPDSQAEQTKGAIPNKYG